MDRGGIEMSTRESRRLKEKRSIIPFGDIMLPVIGLVAVGLLIVGVKLFFLSGPKAPSYSPVSQQPPAARQEVPPKAEAVPTEQVASRTAHQAAPEKEPVLAAPVGGQAAAPSATSPARTQTNENTTARPVKQPEPARKPEPAAPQKPAPPASSSKWGVQIGAFTTNSRAETARQEAIKAGYSPVIRTAVVKGKTYYRVVVPAGNERRDANELSERLKKSGFPIYVVSM